MRVTQLIDSLEPGGAEKMAVNFANSLAEETAFSGLVVTRKLGNLQNDVGSSVSFLFLNRKKRIDFKAVLNFKRFLKINNVAIIHAHSSTFFFATLVKMIYPKIRIIWHDHNGGRNKQSIWQNKMLFICSFFFEKIIVVNYSLLDWAKKNLLCKYVFFISNFVISTKNFNNDEVLFGKEGKRIVCLANLRNPKNHQILLEAFSESKIHEDDWTLHLVGKDSLDDYSRELKNYVTLNKLENKVFFYGTKSNIQGILNQAEIGVLSSTHEGFPLTLLEYGYSDLAVISTNVGHCSEIIIDNQTGLLFNPLDKKTIINSLKSITENNEMREKFSSELFKLITSKFSEKIVIKEVVNLYNRSY